MAANAGFILASASLMLVAHTVRALRWRLLLPKARGIQLLFAVCLGSLCNMFIPFRLGEFVRMLYVWKTTPHNFEQSAASVLVERTTDLLALFLLCLPLALFIPEVRDLLYGPFGVGFCWGVAALLVGVSLRRSAAFRRAVGACAGIFNERISFGILRCSWSFATAIIGPSVVSWRYLSLTLLMWALYMTAYASLLWHMDISFTEVLATFHGTPLRSVYESMASVDNYLPLVAVCILPLFAGVIYIVVRERIAMLKSLSRLLLKHTTSVDMEDMSGQSAFQQHNDYQTYLLSLFGVFQTPFDRFYRLGLNGATVVKFLMGGSGAITAMVQTREAMNIRKFSMGPAGGKLRSQAEWLERERDVLPLAQVIGEKTGDGWYYYDMPYLDTSANLYERVHLRGVQYGHDMLDRILDRLEKYHDRGGAGVADTAVVDRYIADKIIKNFEYIKDRAGSMVDLSRFAINGEWHSIESWDALLRPELLRSLFSTRNTSSIHGDLTLENIITLAGGNEQWFIIDPNGGNIFDSPFLDWAKLFQSLHLGYEILNKSVSCMVENNNISFIAPYTTVYESMYAHLRQRAERRFGSEGLGEIYLHEIVHYLRLIPYKFVVNEYRGMLFFAQCCGLIEQYNHDYAKVDSLQ